MLLTWLDYFFKRHSIIRHASYMTRIFLKRHSIIRHASYMSRIPVAVTGAIFAVIRLIVSPIVFNRALMSALYSNCELSSGTAEHSPRKSAFKSPLWYSRRRRFKSWFEYAIKASPSIRAVKAVAILAFYRAWSDLVAITIFVIRWILMSRDRVTDDSCDHISGFALIVDQPTCDFILNMAWFVNSRQPC